MSTADLTAEIFGPVNVSAGSSSSVPQPVRPKQLHRIAEVRRQQGVSRRRLGRVLKIDTEQLRYEENEHTDLTLSQLYRWQKVLEVPIADLLVESDSPLSAPVMTRARMVRVMKTAAAIFEKTESSSVRRLAQTLVDQLVEIMPELEGISPWHSVGQRRTHNELGRAAEHPIAEPPAWRQF
jgi:transcriptional regulator with XRE-family HTH domain